MQNQNRRIVKCIMWKWKGGEKKMISQISLVVDAGGVVLEAKFLG